MTKRVALCMKGAVSKRGLSDHFYEPGSIYREGYDYININTVALMVKKHIIEANPDYQFDIFIHCWNTDLEQKLIELYNPVLSIFENNNQYGDEIKHKMKKNTDYGGISSALSIKKCIALKKQYENDNNFIYDTVVVYRHDIYLWKDMNLKEYDINAITVNGVIEGDFHFVMNSENADKFANLYDSTELGNYHEVHKWIQRYVSSILKVPFKHDDILPGKYQESPKALKLCSYNRGHLTLEKMAEYGLSEIDLYVYNPKN